jgi:hypothetical protein
MPINSNAAWSADFRSSLNYAATGSIVSLVFDSESAGFANAFQSFAASVTAPAGTSVTWTFRASDSVTGILAAAYTPTISTLTGRYLQVKGDFIAADTATGAVEVQSLSTLSLGNGVNNLIAFSEQFDNAWWVKGDATISSNTALAPDGTMTADKLFENTVNTTHYVYKGIFTPGQPAVGSVYAKASERNWLFMQIGIALVWFDVANGVVGTQVGASGFIESVGNGWYRCSASVSNCSNTNFFVTVATGNGGISYAGNPASGILIWGAQAEVGVTRASTYVPTAGAPGRSMSGGRAVMIEEGTTNLLLRSQEFDNASWTKVEATISPNFDIAPDGTRTADKIFETSANAAHYVTQPGPLTIGQPGLVSVYAKAAERNWLIIQIGNGAVYFNVLNGVLGTQTAANGLIESVGNGWYRCTAYVANVINSNIIFYTSSGDNVSGFPGNTGFGLLIWGAQAEAKAYPTSYVPTTTVSVARNAENVNFLTTGVFATPSTGTFISRFKVDRANQTELQAVIDLGGTGSSGLVVFITPVTQNVRFQHGTVAGGAAATPTSIASLQNNVWHTVGIKWGPNGSKIYINGAFDSSFATGANIVPLANCYIGSNQGSARFLNGLVSDCVFYRDELLDSEMNIYTSTGSVIPVDHRTTYSLKFQDNLLHGEGGMRTTAVKSLADIPTITGSNISWNSTESPTASGAITWAYATNVTLGANSVQKTGGVNSVWDAETFSRGPVLSAGENGYVSFTCGETNTGKMIGFANQNISATFNSISHALYPTAGGQLNVYENGSAIGGSYGTYVTSDVLSIERKNGVVRYLKNGVSFYTSLLPSADSVNLKAAFFNTNASIQNIALYLYPKTEIDTSIDNGATWTVATSSGSITGLATETVGSGKNLLIRQRLSTPRSATSPSLNDTTWSIGQKQTKNKNEYIKPAYSSLRFTPTSLTRWQLENKKFSTSYQLNGSARLIETLQIPTSGVISPASGSVIARVNVEGDILGTSTANHVIFNIGATGNNCIRLEKDTGTTYFAACRSNTGVSSTATSSLDLSEGMHTIGMRWNSSEISIWIDGIKAGFSSNPSLPSTFAALAYIGSLSNGTSQWNSLISQIDIFSEALTDSEMAIYTAATGSVIPITRKHSYQLKFENNLDYGMTGIYTSRAMDSLIPNAKWATYQKQDVTPANTSISYTFAASNNIAGPFENYTTDITAITGRYIKVKIICMSSDVNNFNPQVLDNTVRVYPRSV